MSSPSAAKPRSSIASFLIIAAVVAGGGGAFAYTAGWLSPDRLTPQKFIEAMTPPAGPALGHRRAHAKGVCFTGEFVSNGAGARLSTAQLFAAGRYPVVGRLNLATPMPNAEDASVRVRGLGVQVKTPDGQEWRSAMNDPPFLAAPTPQIFYEMLKATGTKDPEKIKAFAGAHPEFAAFGAWAKSAPFTPSFAENRFNSLNSFVLTDASGSDRTVRWSMVPAASPTTISADEMKARGPSFLEAEIARRVESGPVRWIMRVTLAKPGDPTADPSKVWPEDRETVDVGELVAARIVAEPDGPCRDLNFDPTVLPTGMKTSDDPFPAARSAVYARSFAKRTAEAKDYPANAGAKP